MPFFIAILCALAVVVTQILYGGAMRPVFALPGYVLIGLAGLVGAVEVFSSKRRSPSPWAIGLVSVFAALLVFRCLHSPDPWLGDNYARLILATFATYLLFAFAIVNPRARLVFVGLLLIFAIVQTVFGAIQFAQSKPGTPIPWLSEQLRVWYGSRTLQKAHGFYLNGNHLAWFLNVLVFFGLGLGCWGRLRLGWRILCGYGGLAALVGVGLTLSRGGYIGLAAGFAAFVLLSATVLMIGAAGRRLQLAAVFVGGLLIASLGATFLFSQSYRIQDRFSILTEDYYRDHIIQATLRQAQLDPIQGAGAGMFVYYGRLYREMNYPSDDIYAHNDWAQMASDFGLIAFMLLFAIVAVHAWKGVTSLFNVARRRLRSSSGAQSQTVAILIAALASLAAFVVHSFFDFNMQIPANALLAAACLGMLANPESEQASSKRKRPELISRILGSLLLVISSLAVVYVSWRAAGPELFWLRAENDLVLGETDRAMLKAQSGLQQDTDHPKLRRVLGEAALKGVNSLETPQARWQLLQTSIRELGLATEKAPLETSNFLLLGEAQMRSGRFDDAENSALAAIRLSPTQSTGYLLYGRICEVRGRLPEALRVYQVAASLPGAGDMWENVRRVERKLKEEPAP